MKRLEKAVFILTSAIILGGCGFNPLAQVTYKSDNPENNVAVYDNTTVLKENMDLSWNMDSIHVNLSAGLVDILNIEHSNDNTVFTAGNLSYGENVLELQNKLNTYDKNISFLAYSLDGNKAIGYNINTEYFSACTVKAGYILYCYNEVEKGNGAITDVYTYTADMYHGGSGSIKDSPYGTQYTLEQLMNKALSESDNVAYDMCYKRYGADGYNAFLTELGCKTFLFSNGSNWGHNVKVKDSVIIWLNIYEYLRKDTELSRLLYESCTDTLYSFIGDALPEYDVSHKSGWNGEPLAAYSDAGIVYNGDSSYVIAIFTDSDGSKYDREFVNDTIQRIDAIINN